MNKKIILTTISIINLLVVIIVSGIYIKNKNDIKNYKSFCNNYLKIDSKIFKNEESYLMYIKAMKNYVTVFTKYEGKAELKENDKKNIELKAEEYNNYIDELKSLSPPQEFKEDYEKLIDLYDKDCIRKENINRDFKNNNARSISEDYLTDNKDLIQSRNDFQSKITIVNKQKGINIDEIQK